MLKFNFDIDEDEVYIFMDNILRALTVLIVLHIFSCTIDGNETFFESRLFLKIAYIVVGISLYTVLIRPFFIHLSFGYADKKNKKGDKGKNTFLSINL